MSRQQLVRQGNCRGITLVELLVSMAIGLFILGGVVKVMVDSKENFLAEEQLSYIQDNARFAMNQIINDIRMAGYYGCSSRGQLTNSLNGSAKASGWMFSSDAIKGFEYSETEKQYFPNMRENTDVVIINRGEPEDSVQINFHNPVLAEFRLNRTAEFAAGQVMVVTSPNCANMAIFQMTGPNSGKVEQIEHKTEGASPGNCYQELTSGYQCPSVPGKRVGGGVYPPGSSVMRFSSHAYFVGTSDITGQPSLYRQTLIVDSREASTEAQELASGVENLQILYGVDEDLNGTVDLYNTAKYINDSTMKGINLWDKVVAVRVTLIMRSAHEMFADNTVADLGEGYKSEDRYMRQKVSSTIRIRNRSLGFTISEGLIKVSEDEAE